MSSGKKKPPGAARAGGNEPPARRASPRTAAVPPKAGSTARAAAQAAAAGPGKAPLAIVILAAGAGTRMRSDTPKVLQPLAGRPLLGHVLDTARQLDPAAIHVVYGHGGEAVRAAFAGESVGGRPLGWVEQAQRLGTGHALQQALPYLQPEQMVLVLYGDVPLLTPATLRALLERAGPGSLALLTVELADPRGYGRILRDARGRVRRIVEEQDASPAQRRICECNTGVLAAPARQLAGWLRALRNDNAQGEYYLTDVIAAAVRDGVAVQPLPAQAPEVQGVNDRLQLAQAEAAFRARQAAALLQAGVTLADPARTDVRGRVTAGRDVFIDVNAVLEGDVRLGDGVRIGPNCVIRDCSLGAGTQVQANCVLESAEIGPSCRIGPFARIRPESRLAADVHIGNFVEVKKTSLGEGSKANHLTYLGDAAVGAGVNVGAGTVTCNYDGANKWRTDIGDGAFIGSGSMLVAPVKIGAGATIGAGSTITHEAPAGELTLGRARQATIAGWHRPRKRQAD